MQDLASAHNPQGSQEEIFRQVRGEFDVYCGLIDSKFGTETSGFGSGTEAEYYHALSSLDGKFVMFGRNEDATKKPFNKLSDSDKEQLGKIDTFFKKIGSTQFYFTWNSENFKEKFVAQVEKKIVEYSKISF